MCQVMLVMVCAAQPHTVELHIARLTAPGKEPGMHVKFPESWHIKLHTRRECFTVAIASNAGVN